MSDLENLIFHALKNENNILRAKAELALIDLHNSNPINFFTQCANLVDNPEKSFFTRNSAIIVLGRMASIKNANGFNWDLLSHDAKMHVKSSLLNTLISTQIAIMRSGANTISMIAAIQIPRNEWLDIIAVLAENTVNTQDFGIKNASLTTLGYICEQFKDLNGVKIDSTACQHILGSLIIGLRDTAHEEIIDTSISALRNAIAFLYRMLEDKKVRDSVFGLLLDRMTTPQRIRKVYQALFQFCKYLYPFLGDYFVQIQNFTLNHILQRNQNTLPALQLWATIGTQYVELREQNSMRVNSSQQQIQINNYLQIAEATMLQQVMKCMLIIDNNDLEFPEMRQSAIQTLSLFVQSCNRDVVDKIMSGVSVVINSQNYGERQASAQLFAVACDYPDLPYIETAFSNGFDFLYALIGDNVEIVRKNTLAAFVKFSETFPHFFINHKNAKQIADQIMLIVINSNDKDDKLNSLNILTNITDVLKQTPNDLANDHSILLTKAVQLFKKNIKSKDTNDREFDQRVIIIIMDIIIATQKKDIISQLIDHLIMLYHEIFKINIEDKRIALEQILTILHTAILAIGKMMPQDMVVPKLYEILDLHIRSFGIENEGMNMIGAISATYKKRFSDKVDYYWQFVLQGLELVEQKQLFKATLTCIGDIARSQEQKVVDKIMNVFNRLLAYIQSNIDRQLKISILQCFGDLTLGLKRYAQNFIDNIIEISENCFEAVIKFQTQQSEKAYAEQLKQTLIDMYHCIIFALNDQSRPNMKLANHFPKVATFIVRTCDVSLKPTVNYLKTCIYLIFDSALFYGKIEQQRKQVREITDSVEVNTLIELINRKRDQPQVNDLMIYLESNSLRKH